MTTNWVVVSSLATAGGTLILAGATFASVRSGNRSARIAEESLLAGMRPLLVPSRASDEAIKVTFVDDYNVLVPGGGATAVATDRAIYLTMSLRNAGSGIALMHGWRVELDEQPAEFARPSLESFRRLTRDLYVAAGDIGFWQGAFRDSSEPEFARVGARIASRQPIVLDVLYGDHVGGQRMISRFAFRPREDGAWMATAGRHWNVDRPDPR